MYILRPYHRHGRGVRAFAARRTFRCKLAVATWLAMTFATASALGPGDAASHADTVHDPKVRTEALDADTVVLQQRIAELTASIERMRADLAVTAPTREPAEAPERPALKIVQRPAPETNALVLIALGTFAALLGGVMIGRQRWSERRTGERRFTNLRSDRLEAAPQRAPAPIAESGVDSDIRSETPKESRDNAIEDSLAADPRSMLPQRSEAVLADVDADLIEEQLLRVAFAAAANEANNTPIAPEPPPGKAAAPRRIDLEFTLDADLVEGERHSVKQVMTTEH